MLVLGAMALTLQQRLYLYACIISVCIGMCQWRCWRGMRCQCLLHGPMLPIAAMLLALALQLAIFRLPPGCATALAEPDGNAPRMQPLHHRGVRVAVGVEVALLHHGPAGLHGIQPGRAARSFAAVVAHQQHIGLQGCVGRLRCVPGDDGLLLRRADIARQQGAALAVADVQHAAHGVAGERGVGQVVRGRMQDGKRYAVPLPDLPGNAGHDGADLLQGVIGSDGTQRLHVRARLQHGGRAAYVVAILVAQQQPLRMLVQRIQQGHKYAFARVAAGAVLRPGVKQEAVRAGAHQNGAALPDIGRDQVEMAVCRARRLPQQHRQ